MRMEILRERGSQDFRMRHCVWRKQWREGRICCLRVWGDLIKRKKCLKREENWREKEHIF